MNSPWVLVSLLVVASLQVQSSTLLAQLPPPNQQPGMQTVARMYVLNRGDDEAIPVVVQSRGDVQPVAVMSAPAISLAPNASVATRALRQSWEYRHVVVKAGEDVATSLNRIGDEGWEAVGMTASGGELRVVLKRPK